MKLLPDLYKGPHTTSKEHALLLISFATMEKHKLANEFSTSPLRTQILIIHKSELSNQGFFFAIKNLFINYGTQ